MIPALGSPDEPPGYSYTVCATSFVFPSTASGRRFVFCRRCRPNETMKPKLAQN